MQVTNVVHPIIHVPPTPRHIALLFKLFACYHSLSGRLEETEEELVQLKIEREAERQRRAKYGTANGSAVEAVNSTEPPRETGDDGGETWGTWEPGEPSSEAPPGEQTTSQGSKWHCVYYSVLCKRNYVHVPMRAKPINVVAVRVAASFNIVEVQRAYLLHAHFSNSKRLRVNVSPHY